jgi:integrase
MAWADQLPTGNYRACWRDSDNKQRSRSKDATGKPFTRKAAAERYGAEQESKARRFEASYQGRGMSWGDWEPRWLHLRNVEPSTLRNDKGRIDHHLKPYWGQKRLGRITRSDVQAWVNQLDDNDALSPSTVIRIYHLFSASMKAAVKDGQITVTPCTLVDLPTPPPRKHHYLTRAEFDLTLFHLDEPYRTAAILLAGTGMRFGELAGVHWSNVDLDQAVINVSDTWDVSAERIKAYPKGKKARPVPLAKWVAEALLAIAPEHPGKKCGHPHAKGSPCTSPLVLTSVTGLPLSPSTMAEDHWQPALKAAGVGHTRLHDLRHTFAAWLRLDGVDLETVQKLLGHGSIITTQIYSDIGSSQHDRVRQALDR